LRVFAIAVFLFVAAGIIPGRAAESVLQGVHTQAADDSSVQIALQFSGDLPDVRIVRSGEHTVHVVFVGARVGAHSHPMITKIGEIEHGNFNGFAGIGIRLDLQLRDSPLRLTTQSFPHTHVVIVHVPALHTDNEALETEPLRAQGDEQTAFIPLSYADVSEVAGILVKGAQVSPLDNFNPQSPFAAPTPNPGGGSMGDRYTNTRAPTYVTIPAATILSNKDTPIGAKLDDKVAIDRRLNAIILTGTPAEIASEKRIISYVDVPARSVLLETQIVELTQTAARNLGIDYSDANGNMASATFNASANNRLNTGVSIQAKIAALQESGQAKILAQPRILALNARPAAILSGEAVPIFNSVVVPSGGGTIIENQVQYINVGVSLEILPRIAADGRVTTQIFSEVSTIIDYVQNTPRIAVRQALTSDVVSDGESLVVGGLLQETEITQLRKVPGLGDIPLLGGFFRSTSSSKQTTNLYLVITPHVLTNKTTAPK
jgi:general secretion pathway protein D